MCPCTAGEVQLDARVTQVVATRDSQISDLLAAEPLLEVKLNEFHLEQRKDVKLKQVSQMCSYPVKLRRRMRGYKS